MPRFSWRRHPRRARLVGQTGVVLGLGLALIGQLLVAGDGRVVGLPLLVLGAVVFVIGVSRVAFAPGCDARWREALVEPPSVTDAVSLPAGADATPCLTTSSTIKPSLAGTGPRAIVVPGTLGIIAALLFLTERASLLAWGVWAAALVALLTAFGWMRPNVTLRRDGLGPLLLLLAAIVAAGGARLYALDDLPPGVWEGEARLGLTALDTLGRASATGAEGVPVHGLPAFQALTVAAVGLLGPSPAALRLTEALGGVAFIPAIFLLGRTLLGTGAGLGAAGLGATLLWHVLLSRGGWGYQVWGVTAETLAFASFCHALHRRSPALAAVSGVTLGLALQVSWTSLVVAGPMLAWQLGAGGLPWIRRQGHSTGGPRPGQPTPSGRLARRGCHIWLCANANPRRWPLVVHGGSAGLLVALVPVLCGVVQPGVPLETAGVGADLRSGASRASVAASWEGTTLLVTTEPDLYGRLLAVTGLLNVRGDASPRQNVPGRPMLDPVTGTLFVLGLGLALVRVRERAWTPLVIWLALGLASALRASPTAGPDAALALHALPPALLLAGGALAAVVEAGRQTGRSSRLLWSPELASLLVLATVAANLHALFITFPADASVWAAWSFPQTAAGREISRFADRRTIYVSDDWQRDPTVLLLARTREELRRLDPSQSLPFREDGPVAAVLPGDLEAAVEDVDRLYSDTRTDRTRSPLDSQVAVRSIDVPASEIRAARGVTVRFAPPSRGRIFRETVDSLDLSWPLPNLDAAQGTLDIFTALAVPHFGEYRFRLDGPPGARLDLNDVPLLGAGQEAWAHLAAGNQRLRITAEVVPGTTLAVRWQPPGASGLTPIPPGLLFREQRDASGLLGIYRAGTTWDGPATLAHIDRYIARHVAEPPLPRPYSVEWLGEVDAPDSGAYRLRLDSTGPAALWIDEQPVLRVEGSDAPPTTVLLGEGWHPIRVRFLDEAGPSRFNVLWAPPGDDLTPIPTQRLQPPDGPVPRIISPPAVVSTTLEALDEASVHRLTSLEAEPRGVAVAADGTPLVTAVQPASLLTVHDDTSTSLASPPNVHEPSDVAAGPDGTVWVIDSEEGWLVGLRLDGTADRVFAGPALGLYRPRGVGVGPDGSLYIADTGGNRIVRLRADGTIGSIIGPDVGGAERLRQPTDVAVGADGQIYVVNGEGGTVFRLDTGGHVLGTWSVLSSDTERGAHLAIGPDGSVWVTEPAARRIRRFTPEGAPAGVVSTTRQGRIVRAPVGVAVGPDGTLYVADAELRALIALDVRR
ncbi:MAG: hypothetical protein IT305_20405 [Chloroflexi bacterium]|nr:hypothetical protein [Chloroflexota bacterium]